MRNTHLESSVGYLGHPSPHSTFAQLNSFLPFAANEAPPKSAGVVQSEAGQHSECGDEPTRGHTQGFRNWRCWELPHAAPDFRVKSEAGTQIPITLWPSKRYTFRSLYNKRRAFFWQINNTHRCRPIELSRQSTRYFFIKGSMSN